MKAISLWQPWASAIALGLKQYETRSWKTNYRGELIICSAKKKTKELNSIYLELKFKSNMSNPRSVFPDIFPCWDDLNFGTAIARVNLIDCIRMTEGFINQQTELEKLWGDWYPGRYAWKFESIQPLDPTPIKGAQGFFEIPENVPLILSQRLEVELCQA